MKFNSGVVPILTVIVVSYILILALIGASLLKNKRINVDYPVIVEQQENETEKVKEISDAELYDMYNIGEFDLDIWKSRGKPLIVNFSLKGSEPSEKMEQNLKNINEKYKGQLIIKIVDVEKYMDYIRKYPLSVAPTQLIYDKDGKAYKPSENMKDIVFQEYTSIKNPDDVIMVHEGLMTMEQLEWLVSELLKNNDNKEA